MNLLLSLLCCNTCGLLNNELSDNLSPKVVIVGAGAAGIAAASRLLENGFTDITILEAENRTGGRVHSINFGEYMIDMGAQWVHGEKHNVAFELAWPLELLERMRDNFDIEVNYFLSSGKKLPNNIVQHLRGINQSSDSNITVNRDVRIELLRGYTEKTYLEYYDTPEIHKDLYWLLVYSLKLSGLVKYGADEWRDISDNGLRDYTGCEGDQNINWKNGTYSTVLEILMKKYPNAEQELPVYENTHKNSKVTRINYSEDYDLIRILTADGKEYLADHVIFTPSLGVLKENYEQLFNPPLPKSKIEAIKNLGFGHGAKIWLYYDNPWWENTDSKFIINPIIWTREDANELHVDSARKWMLGVYGVTSAEHKPKVLCLWVATDRSREMESISEELLHDQVTELLEKFYGRHYQVTKPKNIIRSSWNRNENFLGSYSFRSVESDRAYVSYADLAKPIIRDNIPILQFAGEATSQHYATVHGAIESGWREADRLIKLYPKKNEVLPLLKRLIDKLEKNH